MIVGCRNNDCRVAEFVDGTGPLGTSPALGCPACGWPDERDPSTGMTVVEAARWLAALSGSPRYAGDRWVQLLAVDTSANVEHAAAAARRSADPDQLPTLRAVAEQLARHSGGS